MKGATYLDILGVIILLEPIKFNFYTVRYDIPNGTTSSIKIDHGVVSILILCGTIDGFDGTTYGVLES